jgi:ABC-2 type transport system permease protein
MRAIFKREFLSFFRGITGWLYLGITLVLFGLYFSIYCLMQAVPTISYALNSITFAFLITVPILTMKVFAQERRDKVDILTLTSPVPVGRIVLGNTLRCFARI